MKYCLLFITLSQTPKSFLGKKSTVSACIWRSPFRTRQPLDWSCGWDLWRLWQVWSKDNTVSQEAERTRKNLNSSLSGACPPVTHTPPTKQTHRCHSTPPSFRHQSLTRESFNTGCEFGRNKSNSTHLYFKQLPKCAGQLVALP